MVSCPLSISAKILALNLSFLRFGVRADGSKFRKPREVRAGVSHLRSGNLRHQLGVVDLPLDSCVLDRVRDFLAARDRVPPSSILFKDLRAHGTGPRDPSRNASSHAAA